MYPGRYTSSAGAASSPSSQSSSSRPVSAAFRPPRPPSSSSSYTGFPSPAPHHYHHFQQQQQQRNQLNFEGTAIGSSSSLSRPPTTSVNRKPTARKAATVGSVLFPSSSRPPTTSSNAPSPAGSCFPMRDESLSLASSSSSIAARPFSERSRVGDVVAALSELPAPLLVEAVITVLMQDPPSLLRSPITLLAEEYQRQLSRFALRRFCKGGVLPAKLSQEDEYETRAGEENSVAQRRRKLIGSSLFDTSKQHPVLSQPAARWFSAKQRMMKRDDDCDGETETEWTRRKDVRNDEDDGMPQSVVVDSITALSLCAKRPATRELLQESLPIVHRQHQQMHQQHHRPSTVEGEEREEMTSSFDIKSQLLVDSEFQKLHAELVAATTENFSSKRLISQLQKRCNELQTALGVAETAAMSALNGSVIGGGDFTGVGGAGASASRFRGGPSPVVSPSHNRKKSHHAQDDAGKVDDDDVDDDEMAALARLERTDLEEALAREQKQLQYSHVLGASPIAAAAASSLRKRSKVALPGQQQVTPFNNSLYSPVSTSAAAGGGRSNQQVILENSVLKQLVQKLRTRIEELERAAGFQDFFCSANLQMKLSDVVRDNEFLIATATALSHELMTSSNGKFREADSE